MKMILAAVTAIALAVPYELPAEEANIKQLRQGDMRRLVVHSEPKETSNKLFVLDNNEGVATLDQFHGKYVLLNLWASWCAPCRKEMPTLSILQAELGDSNFEVLTIATGKNDEETMRVFFENIGVSNLPLHLDAEQGLARDMGVFGIPATMIIDPKGKEIARLRGDADWSSESAKDIVKALKKQVD